MFARFSLRFFAETVLLNIAAYSNEVFLQLDKDPVSKLHKKHSEVEQKIKL